MSEDPERSSVAHHSMHVTRRGVAGVAALALSGVALAVLVSCTDDSPAATNVKVLRGADVTFGNGTARTELQVKGTTVVSLAVVLSENALDGLPTQSSPMTSQEYVLPLPAGAPSMVFEQVAVNWQPVGHPPMNVYTTPHFDVHHYLITPQQRDAITPADPAFGAKTLRQPAADALPAGYVLDPAAVPRMGVHAAASAGSEFQGAPFASTFIYGFYDGGMIFLEPMMTRAFLSSRPDTTISIVTPARYPKPGAYPTAYGYTYDSAARERRIELRGFVQRQ